MSTDFLLLGIRGNIRFNRQMSVVIHREATKGNVSWRNVRNIK